MELGTSALFSLKGGQESYQDEGEKKSLRRLDSRRGKKGEIAKVNSAKKERRERVLLFVTITTCPSLRNAKKGGSLARQEASAHLIFFFSL